MSTTLTQEEYLEGVELSSLLLLGLQNLKDVQDFIIDVKSQRRSTLDIVSMYSLNPYQFHKLLNLLHAQYYNYGPPSTFRRYKNSTFALNTQGMVINIASRNIITPYIASTGYYYFITYVKGKRYFNFIHQLMARIYLTRPSLNQRYVINHIDGNKLNNNVNNLEYITYSQNTQHAIKHKLRVYNYKLNQQQVQDIRREYNNTDISVRALSRKYILHKETIRDILDNKIHKDISYTRTRYPTNKGIAKFTQDEVKDIRKLYNTTPISIYVIAKDKNVDATTIKKIINNDSYRDDSYIPITREEKKKLRLKKK